MPYDIYYNPVTQASNLGKLSQTARPLVTESENGHLDFQCDSSVSDIKNIQNCDKSIDLFFYFIDHSHRNW